MTTQRHVVFGDDRSVGADIAWEWLCAQQWDDWEIDVVEVEPVAKPADAMPLHEVLSSDGRTAPESCHAVGQHSWTAVADPRIALTEVPGATLLVIGERGRGLLKRMRIGSTAEWFIHCPTTPVVIARNTQPVRTVLACVDGSEHAKAAVDLLASMPWIGGVSVHVIGIVEGQHHPAAAVSNAAETLRAAGAIVHEAVREPDPLTVFVNTRYVIFDVMSDVDPDLVVMGTRGMGGMERMMVGSVATAVTHHATCSVMLARAPESS